MMMSDKTKCSFCFICLADLGQLKLKTGRKRKDDLIRKRRDESAIKLLIKYLLNTNSKIYDEVLEDVLKLGGVYTDDGSGGNNGGKKVLRLCEKCETVGAKLLQLHLELEKLQMRIINEVRSVRRGVLNGSGWLGGIGRESGLECFEQFSKRFCTGIASSNGQKKLFNTLKAFQTAVVEIDERSIRLPLVYLDKYRIAIPQKESDSLFESIPDIVKTEPHYPDEAELEESVAGSQGILSLVDEGVIGVGDDEDGAFEYDDGMLTEYDHDTMIKKEGTDEAVLKSSEIGPTDRSRKSEQEEAIPNPRKRTSAIVARLRMTEVHLRKELQREDVSTTRSTKQKVSKNLKKDESRPKLKSKSRRMRLRKVKRRYYCELCNFSSRYASSFEQHLRKHEKDEKSFHCDICNEGFSTQQHYTFHQERHKGHHKLKCDICWNFINPCDLPTHLKTHVEEVFPCPYCSYWCSSMDKKLTHINLYHFGVELTCDICGKSFQTKRLYGDHLRDVHKAVVEKIKCDVEGCNKAFRRLTALSVHKYCHTDKFACKVCFKRFASQQHLEIHNRVHSGEKPFKCDQCPEAFRSGGSLQAHLIRQHGAAKVKCKICDKEYSTKSSLQYHMGMEHDSGKAKHCTICNRKFGTSFKLRTHMDDCHSEGNNYVCEECGKAFRTSSKYAVHKQIHGEKTHKCPYCSKMFAQRKVLTQHIRTHTGEKPYACEFCGKAFNQAGPRQFHRRKCQLKFSSLTEGSGGTNGASVSAAISLPQPDLNLNEIQISSTS